MTKKHNFNKYLAQLGKEDTPKSLQEFIKTKTGIKPKDLPADHKLLYLEALEVQNLWLYHGYSIAQTRAHGFATCLHSSASVLNSTEIPEAVRVYNANSIKAAQWLLWDFLKHQIGITREDIAADFIGRVRLFKSNAGIRGSITNTVASEIPEAKLNECKYLNLEGHLLFNQGIKTIY